LTAGCRVGASRKNQLSDSQFQLRAFKSFYSTLHSSSPV